MEKPLTTTSDWIKNWQTSIAVKITATVLYAVAAVGFAVAIFLMRDVEGDLNRRYDENADRFALRAAQELYPGTTASLQEAAAALQSDVARFGFDAIIISRDGKTVHLGAPPSGAIAIHRRLFASAAGQEGQAALRLTFYHRPTHAAAVSHRNALLVGTGAAMLVFGFFLTWVILKFISRPILDLINANKAVMQGDLTVRLNSKRQDEFGALANYFDRMINQVLRELTERKQAEEHLARSAEELRMLNEELKSFVYSVSHDLRAPLVNVKGFTAELERTLKEALELIEKSVHDLSVEKRDTLNQLLREDVPEAVGFVGSSIDRMNGLINSMLKLSRYGGRVLDPEPIDMRVLMHFLLDTFAHQIEQKHAAVTIGALPMIVADRTAMEQIMGNLLDNALKYLEPGRSGEIEITAERSEKETIVRVRDNGRGIAENDISKIFEIFRRAGKQDVAGEGMGLAYVKALVRRQGGRIWCESEPGKGTTFSFTIPDPAVARA